MTGTVTPRIFAGSVNLSNASITLACMRVSAGWDRASAISSGRQHPERTKWHPASQTPTEKGFMECMVTHPEGTILCIQSQYTRNRMMHAQGAIFVRLRENGPIQEIKLKLPTNQRTLLGDSLVIFNGCADIVSLEELSVLGVHPPRAWRNVYCNRDEILELFTCRELVAAKSPRPVFASVATGEGVKIVEVAQPAVRLPRRRSRG